MAFECLQKAAASATNLLDALPEHFELYRGLQQAGWVDLCVFFGPWVSHHCGLLLVKNRGIQANEVIILI